MGQKGAARRVVIVGGGIAGVAFFIAAVRFKAVARIDIVDARGVGRSIAFATTESDLLCNTSVETMSLLDDLPDDFLRYLKACGVNAERHSFVPRSYVSRYVADRYLQYSRLAKARGIQHRHTRANAQSVSRLFDGTYRVELDDGGAIIGSDVLICSGSGPSFQPEPVSPFLGRRGLHGSLYPERDVLGSLLPHSHVLVLGSRLSAVDAALLLCKAGHSVLLASPSGRLPSVRTATPRAQISSVDAGAFEQLNLTHPRFYVHLMRQVAIASRAVSGRSLREQVSRSTCCCERLEQEISIAAHGHCDWQEVIVPFMDLAESTWKEKPIEQQRIAMANCSSVLGRYLFAVPLRTARTIADFIAAKRLRVLSAQPSRIREREGWEVEWADAQHETFDAIVCATGFRKPQWRTTTDSVVWDAEASSSLHLPRVTPDLRVYFDGASNPERIWTVGISSQHAVPTVNSVYQTVRQAHSICYSWCKSLVPLRRRGSSS